MTERSIQRLLSEYDRAVGYTEALFADLSDDEIAWRPRPDSSSIGWHLAHQPAVAHFMLRNLIAAEPRLDPALEALADSATPEVERAELPPIARIVEFRRTVADRVRSRLRAIDAGTVEAADQMRVVGATVLTALINHEYQHDVWIGEVRSGAHGRPVTPLPSGLTVVDGYPLVTASSARPPARVPGRTSRPAP